jgi:hypothetical protein
VTKKIAVSDLKTGLSGGYTFIAGTSAFNPADTLTYLINLNYTGGAVTSTNWKDFSVPKTGTLTQISVITRTTNSPTQENISLRVLVNGNTETTIGDISLAANTNVQPFTFTGLTLALTAGDYFCFELVCPTWDTNPTGFQCSITAFIV